MFIQCKSMLMPDYDHYYFAYLLKQVANSRIYVCRILQNYALSCILIPHTNIYTYIHTLKLYKIPIESYFFKFLHLYPANSFCMQLLNFPFFFRFLLRNVSDTNELCTNIRCIYIFLFFF